ncbi:uncharacterized protein EpC_21260 [Erwinia pyrifoliae Ep1/96]|nr:hypothetical protein CPI84_07930 [Erwinia pyrifoliae]MCA8877342.1 hypothetical protein [Erwinia pyrifoliae]CAX55905.1 uncharacterized protein EpC_21260 [Erwinia pyrifoliae Ep1/96]
MALSNHLKKNGFLFNTQENLLHPRVKIKLPFNLLPVHTSVFAADLFSLSADIGLSGGRSANPVSIYQG